MQTKKIAIATDDKINLSEHLGRCKYFAIYTISPDEIIDKEFMENLYTPPMITGVDCDDQKKDIHESKLSHVELAKALSDCKVVLSRGMGEKVFRDLKAYGIIGYIVEDSGTIDEVIQKYLKGELTIDRDAYCTPEEKKKD